MKIPIKINNKKPIYIYIYIKSFLFNESSKRKKEDKLKR